jgi:hypothetical protein
MKRHFSNNMLKFNVIKLRKKGCGKRAENPVINSAWQRPVEINTTKSEAPTVPTGGVSKMSNIPKKSPFCYRTGVETSVRRSQSRRDDVRRLLSEPLISVPEPDSGFMINMIGIISVLSASTRHCEYPFRTETESVMTLTGSTFHERPTNFKSRNLD